MRVGFRILTMAFALILMFPLTTLLAIAAQGGVAIAAPGTRTCPAIAGTGGACLTPYDAIAMLALYAGALLLGVGAVADWRPALETARWIAFGGAGVAVVFAIEAAPMAVPFLALAIFLLGAGAAATLARPQPRNAPSDVSVA